MKLKGTLLVLSLCLVTLAFGQKNFMKEADADFKNESYFDASQKYIKAAAKEKKREKKAKAYFKAGECYRHLLDHKNAQDYYQKSIDLGYNDADPVVYKYMAEMLRQQGEYKKAQDFFEKYLAAKPGDQEAKKGAESCAKAQEWKNNPTRHLVENESQINTEYYDFAPAFGDRKYSTLVFSSSRPSSVGGEVDPRTGETFMDLFITNSDNKNNWGQPKPIDDGKTINTSDNEGASSLTAKGDEIYFTRCPRVKKTNLGCDILMSSKQGNNWKAPVSLFKKDAQDSLNHGHPTLNATETMMVFASDMPGGMGGKDLWMSQYDKRAKEWTKPVNLGSKINTTGDDMFPYIDSDGNLYFSSNGHIGMGGLDMFFAEKSGDNQWNNIENMGYPMNSAADDFGIIFDRSKEPKGYFTSNRAGGKGQDDIYSFRLPPIEFSLECVVKNKKTLEPVSGASLKLVGSDGSMVDVKTDNTGRFLFEEISADKRYLVKETNYTLEASKDKFLKDENRLTTVGYTESKKFYLEFFIQPATKDVVIDFPEVQYAYDKAELLVDERINSKDSLDYLYYTLITNPNISIELQSHTDCRGSDGYNLKLSQRRAESCVKYLIEKGIPKDRLTAKGYGETAPRFDYTKCDDVNKLEKKDNALFEKYHQLNRRTQFRVLTFDYKSANQYGVVAGKEEEAKKFIENWKGKGSK
ncbi:MAG: OmpA family protein [Bacteroidia bacterium]